MTEESRDPRLKKRGPEGLNIETDVGGLKRPKPWDKQDSSTGRSPQSTTLASAKSKAETYASAYGAREPTREKEQPVSRSPLVRQNSQPAVSAVDPRRRAMLASNAPIAPMLATGDTAAERRESGQFSKDGSVITSMSPRSGSTTPLSRTATRDTSPSSSMEKLLLNLTSKMSEAALYAVKYYLAKDSVSGQTGRSSLANEEGSTNKTQDKTKAYKGLQKEAASSHEKAKLEIKEMTHELTAALTSTNTSTDSNSALPEAVNTKLEALMRRMDAQEAENVELKRSQAELEKSNNVLKTQMAASSKIMGSLRKFTGMDDADADGTTLLQRIIDIANNFNIVQGDHGVIQEQQAITENRLSSLEKRGDAEKIRADRESDLLRSIDKEVGHLGDGLKHLQKEADKTADDVIYLLDKSRDTRSRLVDLENGKGARDDKGTPARSLTGGASTPIKAEGELNRKIGSLERDMLGIREQLKIIPTTDAVEKLRTELEDVKKAATAESASFTHGSPIAQDVQKLQYAVADLKKDTDKRVRMLEDAQEPPTKRAAAASQPVAAVVGVDVDLIGRRLDALEVKTDGEYDLNMLATAIQTVETDRGTLEAEVERKHKIIVQHITDETQPLKDGIAQLNDNVKKLDETDSDLIGVIQRLSQGFEILEQASTRAKTLEDRVGVAETGMTELTGRVDRSVESLAETTKRLTRVEEDSLRQQSNVSSLRGPSSSSFPANNRSAAGPPIIASPQSMQPPSQAASAQHAAGRQNFAPTAQANGPGIDVQTGRPTSNPPNAMSFPQAPAVLPQGGQILVELLNRFAKLEQLVGGMQLVSQRLDNNVNAVQSLEQRYQNIMTDDIVKRMTRQALAYAPTAEQVQHALKEVNALKSNMQVLFNRLQQHDANNQSLTDRVNGLDVQVKAGKANNTAEGSDQRLDAYCSLADRLVIAVQALEKSRKNIEEWKTTIENWKTDTGQSMSAVSAGMRVITEWRTVIDTWISTTNQWKTVDDQWKKSTSARVAMLDAHHAENANDFERYDVDIKQMQDALMKLAPVEKQLAKLDTRSLQETVDKIKDAVPKLAQKIRDTEILFGDRVEYEVQNIDFLRDNVRQLRKEAGLPKVDWKNRTMSLPKADKGQHSDRRRNNRTISDDEE